MKISTKNIPYYSFLFLSFLASKFWYSMATTDQLLFLLSPTDFFVSIFCSGKHHYLSNVGFYYEGLNIVIEKSCSGFNFLLLCFMICSVVGLPYFHHWKHKIAMLCFSLLLSLTLTTAVNVARITTAIFLKKHLNLNQTFAPQFHEMQGVFIYLCSLLLFYKALTYLLPRLKLAL